MDAYGNPPNPQFYKRNGKPKKSDDCTTKKIFAPLKGYRRTIAQDQRDF